MPRNWMLLLGMVFCIAAVTARPCPAEGLGRNLLPYGDFENRGANGAAEGWSVEDWGGWSEARAEVVAGGRVGSGCLQIKADAPLASFTCSSAPVSIPRGEPLLLTAWYRTERMPNAQIALATFREGFAENRWKTPTVIARGKALSEAREWRAVSVAVEACDVAREAVVLLRMSGQGAVRIDDVQLSTSPRACTLAIEAGGDVTRLPDTRSARVRIGGVVPARAALVLVAEWGAGKTSEQSVPLDRRAEGEEAMDVAYKCPAGEPHRLQAVLVQQDDWALLAEAERHCPALMTAWFTLPVARPFLYSSFALDEARLTVDIAASEALWRDLSVDVSLRRARAVDPKEGSAATRPIEQVSVRAIAERTSVLSLPTRKLAEGSYEAVVRLARGKDMVQEAFLPLTRVASRPWEVPFDARGNLIADGLPFFPIAVHDVNTPDALDAVADAGFNTIIQPTAYASTELVDKARDLGLKVVIQADDADQDRWGRLVAKFGSHPAVIAWATLEGPDDVPVPVQVARDLHTFLLFSDPYHPALTPIASTDGFWNYQDTFDIAAVNRYPLPVFGLEGFERDILTARAAARGPKPVWAGIQACPRPGVSPAAEERLPLPAEYRCMAYLAIVSGARGLGTLVYHRPKLGGAPAFTLPEDAPELWREAEKVNGELRYWVPALVAPDAAEQPSVEGGTIRALMKREPHQLVLFAVNMSASPTTATLGVPEVGPCAARSALDGRDVTVGEGGTLSDEFPPYGVRVYVLPLPAGNP